MPAMGRNTASMFGSSLSRIFPVIGGAVYLSLMDQRSRLFTNSESVVPSALPRGLAMIFHN